VGLPVPGGGHRLRFPRAHRARHRLGTVHGAARPDRRACPLRHRRALPPQFRERRAPREAGIPRDRPFPRGRLEVRPVGRRGLLGPRRRRHGARMSWETWIAFCALETMLCLSPGPAVVFVVSAALGRGPRSGFAAAFGILAGNAFYFALSATGIAAIILASSALFTALKWAGAAYL